MRTSDRSFDFLRDHLEDVLFRSLRQIAQTAQAQPVKDGSHKTCPAVHLEVQTVPDPEVSEPSSQSVGLDGAGHCPPKASVFRQLFSGNPSTCPRFFTGL